MIFGLIFGTVRAFRSCLEKLECWMQLCVLPAMYISTL